MTLSLSTVEDASGAAAVRGQVGALLAVAFAEPPYNDTLRDTEQSLKRFDRHTRMPGFRLVLALDDGAPVALAYGYRLPADTRWWSGALDPVPAEVSAEDGRRTFAVFELAVDPARRREHLGARVHEALLAHRPEQRAILNVHQDAEAAQGFYRALGYRRVTSVIPWTGAPVYDVMLLDLERPAVSGGA
jgi:ribosomal protein S18 acetylase RimI-like enzyme